MIIKKNKNLGSLIATPDDKLGRADARLVMTLSKISRELKNKFNSLYHYEATYKKANIEVANFNWKDKDVVSTNLRANNFSVIIEE